ncbi:hypothetical protein PMAYCL1PPCAC_21299, partial [Pristionchus mayeri]
LLLLIPLTAAGAQADLGFECDDKKCTFSLQIPQSAVSFVDVDRLQCEINELNGNVTVLRASEEMIDNEEQTFISDFDDLYDGVQSNLTELFNLSASLNETTSIEIPNVQEKVIQANQLKDALYCMVNNGDPKECGQGVPEIPTTRAPIDVTGSTTNEEPITEPNTGTTTTVAPNTGTTTTAVLNTGTTTTPEPNTGTTTTVEPNTGSTTTEEKVSTTRQPAQSPGTDEPATTEAPGTVEPKSSTS